MFYIPLLKNACMISNNTTRDSSNSRFIFPSDKFRRKKLFSQYPFSITIVRNSFCLFPIYRINLEIPVKRRKTCFEYCDLDKQCGQVIPESMKSYAWMSVTIAKRRTEGTRNGDFSNVRGVRLENYLCCCWYLEWRESQNMLTAREGRAIDPKSIIS